MGSRDEDWSDVRHIFPAPGRGQLGPVDPIGAAGPIWPGTGDVGGLVAALGEIYAYPGQSADGLPAGDGRSHRDGPWVRANMIASVDGAVAVDGRSWRLSGPADRLVFTVLRSLADVIMVGAETARAERYRQARPDALWQRLRAGRPPAPPIAVLSRSVDLDLGSRLFGDQADARNARTARTIVITTQLARERQLRAAARVADVIVAGAAAVSMTAAIGALAARGHRDILVEGGSNVLGQLAADNLLDELCLTISPVLEGGFSPLRLTGSSRAAAAAGAGDVAERLTKMRLASVIEDEGFLLNRYVRG
jgi:riboflavin biosynthesis pyrimidine reductase